MLFAGLVAASGLWAAPADPPGANAHRNPVVEAVHIEITGDAGDPAKMKKIARNLIDLVEGEAFSEARFSRSVAALKRSNLFAAVDVPDPDWEKPVIELVFRLEPFARIKDLRVQDGFPLLKKEIRNVMTIATGDVFTPERLEEQKAYIEALFVREGYIRPDIRLSAQKDPEDGHVIVSVDIRKGPFYHVEAVRLKGNAAFSGVRLKMRLETWQASKLLGGASRFVEKDLEEDIETLRQFYRSKGYCEVTLDSEVRKDADTCCVRVGISISEGPRYKVDFSGNRAFWGFTLKKDLVLFTEGNTRGFGLRKSIRNIAQRYRAAGYPDIRVRTSEPQSGPDKGGVRHVTFEIEEGARRIVESIAISGNRAFDNEKIRKQMIIAPPGLIHDGQYVPETLNEDIRAIKALYLESGYRNVAIETHVEEKALETQALVGVDVALSIDAGPRTTVGDVSVEGLGDTMLAKPVRVLSMKAGSPFREYLLKTDQSALAAWISEAGYPHVKVETEVSISSDETSADIVYTVVPGSYVQMGRAFFSGNFKTRDSVLKREMELSEGDPFSLSQILASQRNIRSVNAVAAARFKTIGLAGDADTDAQTDQVDMLAEIREKKPYFLEAAAGYDTQRLFYINLAGGNSNLLGLNKELRAALEWSQIGHRGELTLTEPRFLGTRIASSTNLYTETLEELNKNFGIRTHGASLGLSRDISRDLRSSLNFQYEYREQYRTDDQPVPVEEKNQYAPRSILVTTPSLVYNTTDSYVRPRRGVRAAFSVDASKGLDNSLDDFLKYRLDGRYYYTPFERFTLAAHGRVGYIDPYGKSKRIPEDQLFFLGGIADVRGFSENRLRFDDQRDPVGGRSLILGSLEARLELGLNFELALFYDTGAVREPLVDAGSDEFRSSSGIGLRYITPIGPIGLMYGWKLDRKAGEDPGALHFAIGYTF